MPAVCFDGRVDGDWDWAEEEMVVRRSALEPVGAQSLALVLEQLHTP